MMKIIKGKMDLPQKVFLYGKQGVGKTTFAATIPNILLIDVEGSSQEIDCSRVLPESSAAVINILKEMQKDAQGFANICIDSADSLDQMMIEDICRTGGKETINDFGFGKGQLMLEAKWMEVIRYFDSLKKIGFGILLIGHHQIVRVEDPRFDTYDTIQMNVSKRIVPLLRDRFDSILFCDWEKEQVKQKNGRSTMLDSDKRIVYTTHSESFEVKSRKTLPPIVPLEYEALEVLFSKKVPKLTTPGEIFQKLLKDAKVTEKEVREALFKNGKIESVDIEFDILFQEKINKKWSSVIEYVKNGKETANVNS